MRPVLSSLLVAVGCALSAAPGARADAVAPKSASAFRDSVGVVTHIVYYNTPYGQWPRVVDKLEELGVRHVREGVYANPRRQWREWNEAYYRAVELAADRGIRFVFGVGPPGNESGTLDQQLQVVAGRLRGAAEAIEAPNEFDHFVGGARWPSVLGRHVRALYRKAKANPALRRLPVVAPSFGTWDGPRRFGSRRASVDVGNVHPYTGGLSPQPAHVRAELARARRWRALAPPGPPRPASTTR